MRVVMTWDNSKIERDLKIKKKENNSTQKTLTRKKR